MRLDKVKLHNFRSFSKEQIIKFDDLTTIIGNNSSGKTAALAALNIMFSQISYDRILKISRKKIDAFFLWLYHVLNVR